MAAMLLQGCHRNGFPPRSKSQPVAVFPDKWAAGATAATMCYPLCTHHLDLLLSPKKRQWCLEGGPARLHAVPLILSHRRKWQRAFQYLYYSCNCQFSVQIPEHNFALSL